MFDSVQLHRWQPTRLPCPWDSPGKNTGVGCHFLLQCRKVKSESEVTQSCPTLCDPMDCSPPGSSIHGSFQARALEWGAIASSAGHTMITPEPSPRLPKPICDLSRTVHGCPPSQDLLQSLPLVLTVLFTLYTSLPHSPHFLWHCLGIAMEISG